MRARHEIAFIAGINEDVTGEGARGVVDQVLRHKRGKVSLIQHRGLEAVFFPHLDFRLLRHHFVVEHLGDLGLEFLPGLAGGELLRVFSVGVVVVLLHAFEEFIRQATHRGAVAGVGGGQSTAHYAAQVVVDVHQRHAVAIARRRYCRHDAGGRAAVHYDLSMNFTRLLRRRKEWMDESESKAGEGESHRRSKQPRPEESCVNSW